MSAPIIVVAGIGAGGGTGGAVARRFASKGYRVALLARNAESLTKLAEEIKASGGHAAAFPVVSYTPTAIRSAFQGIKSQWPGASLRVAVWNAADMAFKPFLDVNEGDLTKIADTNVHGPFAFSSEVILAFKELDLDDRGTRGTLIFTSGTSSLRGTANTSAHAAGKFALRALSQSLAKEYGKENIHVSNVVINGSIATDRNNGGDPDVQLFPDAIAETYEFLAHQHRSAYTWELDLRPAHQQW